MNTYFKQILEQNRKKCIRSIALVEASLKRIQSFDDSKDYTADELEPFDALCDRFVRAVEVALKYFRSLEFDQFAERSETTRDLLNRMEKLEIITSVGLWFEMRNVRNRIVHDYLPGAFGQIIEDICSHFGEELRGVKKKLGDIVW